MVNSFEFEVIIKLALGFVLARNYRSRKRIFK